MITDCFFVDSPSDLQDPQGKAYPICWTEQKEIPPGDLESDSTIETALKSSHEAYPWSPSVVGTLADGRNVYFELVESPDAYKSLGVYLASSYFELAALHPEIASKCAEAEYELDGVYGRCKLSDLPTGASITGIYPPVAYLGRKASIDPEIPSLSDIDRSLQDAKMRLKPFAISYVKTHPSCTEMTLMTAITGAYGVYDAGLSKKLMELYVQGAFDQGYTLGPTFETFRDWVVATPVEILERI